MTVTPLYRSDLLPADIPAVAVFLLAMAAVGLSAGLHVLRRRTHAAAWRRAWFVPLVPASAAAFWACLQFLGRIVKLDTPWSLWPLALAGALAFEGIGILYDAERRAAGPRIGLTLLILRRTLIALLILQLAQPVYVRENKRSLQRQAVVLLDDSASMYLNDPQAAADEKLALAGLFGIQAASGQTPLDSMARDLTALRHLIAAEIPALDAAPDATPMALRSRIADRRAPLEELRRLAAETVRQHTEAIAQRIEQPLEPGARASLVELHAWLQKGAPSLLVQDIAGLATARSEEFRDRHRQLREHLRAAMDETARVLEQIPELNAACSRAALERLTAEDRNRIDNLASLTRAGVAREILTAERTDHKALLQELARTYQVQLIRFGATALDVEPKSWQTDAAPADRDLPPSFRDSTDLAAAFEHVLVNTSPDSLAGVIVLTDGRHNAAPDPLAAATRLRCPVHTVLLGSREPPRDAAVLAARAPESIYLGDTVTIRADLRFDGLQGRQIHVRLLRADADQPVDEDTVTVPADRFRTTVRFTDTPAREALFHYTVEIEPQSGEVRDNNNRWDVLTSTSRQRTRMLLVDNRPRWEFRYLRNLFLGRDRSVQLQYVLLNPDRLADTPKPPLIPASAARPFGEAEATTLPASPTEWRKFDAIVLGDIPPESITPDQWKTLDGCVSERGALLVVIAGPNFMPFAHHDRVLQELLPVRYRTASGPLFEGPEPLFKFSLTGEGRQHPVMQQSPNPAENAAIWAGFPAIPWRFAVSDVKEGATVLAYATPVSGAAAEATAPAADRADPDLANPLVIARTHGNGKVIFLATDRTWRLRYKRGDLCHHRFWGQLLRWGAGERLRSGTEYVRLGTDRLTYGPKDPIRIDARLLGLQYEAVNAAQVTAQIYRDNTLVLRKPLEFRKASNGLYEGLLDPLNAPGAYRVELEGPQIDELLRETPGGRAETAFSVTTAPPPLELAELTIDPDPPNALALATGGTVVGPADASRLPNRLLAAENTRIEQSRRSLWDSWPFLAIVILLLCTEWALRKHVRLP